MENEQVRVTVGWLTMPQANTELSHSPRSSSGCPGLQGQTGAEVPGERWDMVAGPCPAAHGWALAGKGFEIERAVRGKKREAQDNMTNWEIFYSGLKMQWIHSACQCWAHQPVLSFWEGLSCRLVWTLHPTTRNLAFHPGGNSTTCYCEALKYFRHGKNEDSSFTCLNGSSAPLYHSWASLLPIYPCPSQEVTPPSLAVPNLHGGRQQTIEIRSVASGAGFSGS